MSASVQTVLPTAPAIKLCPSTVVTLPDIDPGKSKTVESSAPSDSFSWEDSQRLTQLMGQKVYERQGEILDLATHLPRAQGIVGDLPAEWLIKIKAEDREKRRSDIFTALKNTTTQIRDICHGRLILARGMGAVIRANTKNRKEEEPEVEDSELANTLKTAGITDESQAVKFMFAGEGCYGTVHRFDVNNKPFALKLFKQKITDMGKANDLQGSPVEQNRAAFIQKNIPHNPFAKFYLGDIESGYMVTDYIESAPSSAKPVDPPSVDFSEWGIECGDIGVNEANIIQGKIIDYGGIFATEKAKPAATK